MCGIFGELKFDAAATFGDRCDVATDTLAHRGPDDRGTWSDDLVFMGMRRLSIIDLETGHQPIWNEDGSACIILNGEIYNFLDLRAELESKGHRYRTRSDTEVVLHAFEEWGAGCLRRLNGMFALAIWDRRRRSLFLARDRVGEKPLYYYNDGRRLMFASEIKALLVDPAVPREVCPKGLANYLAFGHSLSPDTMYRGIRKVPPGCYLEAGPGAPRLVRYWDIGDEAAPVAENHTDDGYARDILDLLDDSVRRRMIADVPVGAFLSGGVDSSAIVALMQRHATAPVKTFSLGFTANGAYNELGDARKVARFLSTDHHELEVGHVDLVERLQELVYHYDEPFADAAAFPVLLLSRFARKQVKVVLTGDGGDELFGGYRRYAADQLSPAYQRLPGLVTRTLVPALVRRLPRLRRIKRTVATLPIVEPGRRYAHWLLLFTPQMQAELLRPEVVSALGDYDPSASYPELYEALGGSAAADHLNRLMYVDTKTWLADDYMEKTDKATMAAGLEARLPLLDHRLVELAFRIPSRLKIRGWATKRILKRAVRELVPPDVLSKPKHGFAVPTDPWFRGGLKQFSAEVLFDRRTVSRGYFDAGVVARLWKEHEEGTNVWDSHLWLLLNFELWHRRFLDSPGT